MDPIVRAFVFIVAVALGSILIVSLARFVSRRDVVRISLGSGIVASYAPHLLLTPIAIVGWGMLLVVLFSLTIGLEGAVLLVVGIVGAARICAYYSEDVAFELARIMPLALIGASLIVSSVAVPWVGVTPLGGTVLIVVVEWVLRIGSGVIEGFEPPHL